MSNLNACIIFVITIDVHFFFRCRSLNVDMEWYYHSEKEDDSNMEVDIGYIPLLQVKQLQPSSPAVLRDSDGTIVDRR